MRKITFVNIIYSAFFIFLTHAMEQSHNITIFVGDEPYEISYSQALQSPLITLLLSQQKSAHKITLPSTFDPEIFDYLYKDMVGIPYDTEPLKHDTLKRMQHAAEALGITSLTNRYAALLEKYSLVTLSVDDIEYILTPEEASLFGTLKNMLDDMGISRETIPLPSSISSKIFDYIMKDIKHISYDRTLLDDETLIALINATNYLDNEDLLTRYLNHLADRLSIINIYSKLEQSIALLESLPSEMHARLSAKIAYITLETFQTLPQAALKRVPERENIYYKKMWMSPDKQYLVFLEKNEKASSLVVIDTHTNTLLWQEDGSGISSVTFSSDSTQILLKKNKTLLVLRDAHSGKLLWQKGQKLDFKILAFTPNNAPIIFLLKNLKGKKIVIIDARTGLRFGKTILQNFKDITGCFYDAHMGSFIIKGVQESGKDVVFVIDIATSEKIKNRKGDRVTVSPTGKQIISLTDSNITVENSADDEHTFSWDYPKKFTKIPFICSFAPDSSALTLLDYQERILMILNLQTEESIVLDPVKKPIQRYTVFFSPQAQFLLYYTNSNTYTVFNVITKKEMWSTEFDTGIENPYFLSESAIIFTQKPTFLNFYSTRTGALIANIDVHHRIDFGRKFFITNNYIYCLLNRIESLNKLSIICIDTTSLSITAELLECDTDIHKALLLSFIMQRIKVDKFIPLGKFLDILGYQELSEELHAMVNHHNQGMQRSSKQ